MVNIYKYMQGCSVDLHRFFWFLEPYKMLVVHSKYRNKFFVHHLKMNNVSMQQVFMWKTDSIGPEVECWNTVLSVEQYFCGHV